MSLTLYAAAIVTCAAFLACKPDSAPQAESVAAWTELEQLLADMRHAVVEEAESPLEVTDGVMIREFHRDRSQEAAARLAIERLDVPAERTKTGAEQLAGGQQMLRAAELANTRLSDEQVATWVRRVKSSTEALFEFRKAIGMVNLAYGVFRSNQAVVVTMEHAAARQAQPNPLVNYVNIQMELDQGESLVIEGRPPENRYWMLQFCDRWMSAPGGRQSGWLNDSQVELEPDGGYRIVVAPKTRE